MKPFLMMTLLAGALISSSGAIAAEQGDMPPGQGRQMERLQTKLGLSDDQVSQINAIETAQRDKMKALHDDFLTQIKALLSEEQAAKFEQSQQRRRPPQGMGEGQRPPPDGAMGDMQGQRPPPPPEGAMGAQGQRPPMRDGAAPAGGMVEGMKKDLDLSDEQASQIEALQQQQRTEMEALRTETQTLIKQVLTAEQAAQFEQMQPPRFGGNRPK